MKPLYFYLLLISSFFTVQTIQAKSQPKAPILTLTEAKRAFGKGNYNYALPTFLRLASKSTKDATLSYYAGVCLFETGDLHQAEGYLQKAHEKRVSGSSRYLAKLYYKQGRLKDLPAVIEQMNEEKIPTEEIEFMEMIRRKADSYSLMLKNVDGIEVIDSIVVDKSEFIRFYNLSKESGSIYPFTEFFGKKRKSANAEYCSVYENEKQNRIIYSKSNSKGAIDLYSASVVDGRYEEGELLGGAINSKYNETYPFLLSDGMTIYFSSDNPEGLGGYDLYVSRYSFSSEGYLVPESMGMPYNSVYNDYMLAIDEINRFGWFASDRYQPEGKVVVYIFNVASERVRVDDPLKAIAIAELRSIRSTQKSGVDYSKRRELIKHLGRSQNDDNQKKIRYVINDQMIYYSLDQFESPLARKYYKQYIEEKQKYLAEKNMLEMLREDYRKTTIQEEKSLLAFKIYQCEEAVNAHEYLFRRAEMLPRNAELEYLNQKSTSVSK